MGIRYGRVDWDWILFRNRRVLRRDRRKER